MSNRAVEFEAMLTLAAGWVAEQERIALREGIPLDEFQMQDARTVGVRHPDRVRLLVLPQVPIPEHPALRAFCEATKAITVRTWGLCLRYGIVVRNDCRGRRDVVVHELVHTSQYERLGGVRQFLEQYMQECRTIGYPANPMEQEAIKTAERICAV